MTNLIVAFPNRENARYIKKILMQSGFCVSVVCTTGAQALQSAGELGGGIVICGYQSGGYGIFRAPRISAAGI